MALSEEKIKENADRFFNTAKKYGAMNDSLMEYLGKDIVQAPATTKTDMHNAFEGGLLDHILRVAKYAYRINQQLKHQVDENSLMKVAFVHQIGKTFMYKPQENSWRVKNMGEAYEYVDMDVSLKVGERSAFYAMKHGIELTESEYQAILNTSKEFDKQAKYFTDTLGVVIAQAIELAIIEEKNDNK